MLERCCISSLLDEIECYPHRVKRSKYCNPTFIVEEFSELGPVGFTYQVEEGFPMLKLCVIILCLSVCYIYIYINLKNKLIVFKKSD